MKRYKVINWPREESITDPQWLVVVNPRDGSYFPIGEIGKVAKSYGADQSEIKRLREALKKIRNMTDVDDPDSYRADDREGCLDAVYGEAVDGLSPDHSGDGNDMMKEG